MAEVVIEGVTVVPGGGRPPVGPATVVLDADGVVSAIEPGGPDRGVQLVPSAVDLHLDNLTERRRPRATVELDPVALVTTLDVECAAAGIGVVCIAARCEDSPGKGIELRHALELTEAVEALGPRLACDWRIHARVEVTDDGAINALDAILATSSRVALLSVMEHSGHRTRFGSLEEHRQFYAADWGVSLEEVDRIIAAKAAGLEGVEGRRRAVADRAAATGIPLASHDDRDVADVDAAHGLGAVVAEFPLSVEAAKRARALGMASVLGAPNAVRGRSTAPGNLLVADAVAAGVCDVLCSDYLPAALQEAPVALDAAGVMPLDVGIDLVSRNPAAALGLTIPEIAVGVPISAYLRRRIGDSRLGLAMWRDGRQVFGRADEAVPVLVGT